MKKIAILHPGQMGVTIAAAAKAAGNEVYWCGSGRSADTTHRANEAGLLECNSLQDLCDTAEFIFSVCPPAQGLSLAREVADAGFTGVYVDCNAVSPGTSVQTGDSIQDAGGSYVDGGIIGPPARAAGSTRLYLSGAKATDVLSVFSGSVLDVQVISNNIGDASALKMAYAGWTKGSAALLMTMYSMAEHYNISDALLAEWSLSIPGLDKTLSNAAKGNAPKAWRFVGEMQQIADTVSESNLDSEWFRAAEKTYARLAPMKNADSPSLDSVVTRLLNPDDD